MKYTREKYTRDWRHPNTRPLHIKCDKQWSEKKKLKKNEHGLEIVERAPQ